MYLDEINNPDSGLCRNDVWVTKHTLLKWSEAEWAGEAEPSQPL